LFPFFFIDIFIDITESRNPRKGRSSEPSDTTCTDKTEQVGDITGWPDIRGCTAWWVIALCTAHGANTCHEHVLMAAT